jgi:hypothetical protein
MTIHRVKSVIGVLVAGSMMLGSTAALATAAPAPQVDPWAALTAMSGGAPAAAMCGTAAAATAATAAATAAQPTGGCVLPVLDAPPPMAAAAPPIVPVVAAEGGGFGTAPLLLGLLAIVGGIGVYLAVRNNGHPNSPA